VNVFRWSRPYHGHPLDPLIALFGEQRDRGRDRRPRRGWLSKANRRAACRHCSSTGGRYGGAALWRTAVHGCYDYADDQIFGVVPHRKSAKNSLAAIKRTAGNAASTERERVCLILDNLSVHKSKKIKAWCQKNNVELCFTPPYSSWGDPVEAHFGPPREFVLNNSDHPNHTLLTNRIHAYLAWRNANPRDPVILAAERRRRAEMRAEKQRRWGRPAPRAA
jgi:hypothetical protein